MEEVLQVRRCAKVVKGGRRFHFSALVVTGDQNGHVGVGLGKANVVAAAIQKARNRAVSHMEEIPIVNDTIPHEVFGHSDSTGVKMLPAQAGTGVIAGTVPRAILMCAGVANILSKVYGKRNPMNMARATMDALHQLKTRETIEALRGVKLS
jgi:small subunit ribosomal protein S5